jgi:hypothetical protein
MAYAWGVEGLKGNSTEVIIKKDKPDRGGGRKGTMEPCQEAFSKWLSPWMMAISLYDREHHRPDYFRYLWLGAGVRCLTHHQAKDKSLFSRCHNSRLARVP